MTLYNTTGVVEGLNVLFQAVKRRARESTRMHTIRTIIRLHGICEVAPPFMTLK